ncbi:hypothetical protein BASA81_001492 [Batrachochytrium salamandrivorans]|nr:hypothetical protein BASA81_001492 [Batrachochytrium salamandrivorans]
MGNEASSSVQNFRYPSGNVYTGQLLGKKRHGTGQLTWPDGARYEGTFASDKLHGQGKLVFPNGSVYEGGFHENNPQGNGQLTTRNGEVLRGFFSFQGRSDRTHVPVGKYQFSGQLIDSKTSWSQPLNGPLALYLLSGLVSLPNMNDPMEAMLPYAVATSAAAGLTGESEKGGNGALPVAAVVQSLPSSSDSISYGKHEQAFAAKHKHDHVAADVFDPRLLLASVGVPVNPVNTNAQRQRDIRAQEQHQQLQREFGGGDNIPVATAVYRPQ